MKIHLTSSMELGIRYFWDKKIRLSAAVTICWPHSGIWHRRETTHPGTLSREPFASPNSPPKGRRCEEGPRGAPAALLPEQLPDTTKPASFSMGWTSVWQLVFYKDSHVSISHPTCSSYNVPLTFSYREVGSIPSPRHESGQLCVYHGIDTMWLLRLGHTGDRTPAQVIWPPSHHAGRKPKQPHGETKWSPSPTVPTEFLPKPNLNPERSERWDFR